MCQFLPSLSFEVSLGAPCHSALAIWLTTLLFAFMIVRGSLKYNQVIGVLASTRASCSPAKELNL
jgi:hypothetical protein